MKVIYKYPLDKTMTHEMPEGAEVLHVGIQPQGLTLWALVKVEHPDHEGPQETRTFRVYGTGHPIADQVPQDYIGTVQDGLFVWHVFELREEEDGEGG